MPVEAPASPPARPIDPAAVPLSIYVHLPWCVRKCPYCDFNSHRAPDALPEAAYIRALTADMDSEAGACAGRPIRSIFIGGGTPSLFSAQAIGDILDAIRARFTLAQDCEITLEANPGASEQARFAGFREAGVNRLSIGIQSLDNGQLGRLGRIHDADAARAAVTAARAAGFDNFNTDLMYALPEQTPDQAAADLTALIALGAPHVSYYQLTLEPGTAFFHRPPPLPGDDAQWAIHEQGARLLTQAGFRQYEISAWARPGHACRHNLNYWQFGDYLGFGAGAHGKLTDPDGRVVRRARQPLPNRYQISAGTPGAIASERRLDADDLQFEYLLNALRLNGGFALRDYEARTGLPGAPLLAQLRRYPDLVEIDERIRCTATGALHLDDLLARLLPETAA